MERRIGTLEQYGGKDLVLFIEVDKKFLPRLAANGFTEDQVYAMASSRSTLPLKNLVGVGEHGKDEEILSLLLGSRILDNVRFGVSYRGKSYGSTSTTET